MENCPNLLTASSFWVRKLLSYWLVKESIYDSSSFINSFYSEASCIESSPYFYENVKSKLSEMRFPRDSNLISNGPRTSC